MLYCEQLAFSLLKKGAIDSSYSAACLCFRVFAQTDHLFFPLGLLSLRYTLSCRDSLILIQFWRTPLRELTSVTKNATLTLESEDGGNPVEGSQQRNGMMVCCPSDWRIQNIDQSPLLIVLTFHKLPAPAAAPSPPVLTAAPVASKAQPALVHSDEWVD